MFCTRDRSSVFDKRVESYDTRLEVRFIRQNYNTCRACSRTHALTVDGNWDGHVTIILLVLKTDLMTLATLQSSKLQHRAQCSKYTACVVLSYSRLLDELFSRISFFKGAGSTVLLGRTGPVTL